MGRRAFALPAVQRHPTLALQLPAIMQEQRLSAPWQHLRQRLRPGLQATSNMHAGAAHVCSRFSGFLAGARCGCQTGRPGQRHAGAARVCARAASEADVPGMLTWPRRPCTPRADSPAGPAERARAEGGVRVGVAPQAAPPAGHPIGRQRLPVAADHGQRLHLVPRPRGPAVRALVVRPQIRPSSAVSALPHPTADFEELLQPWSTPGLLRGVTVEPEPQV